ncbi:MAG: hypothetical protein JXQ91_15260 [Vannielia sp.]|uniref:hypothetical protein n=1 Tax=Rhodobacterales TaxID=204455 RepID=UPI00209440E6|nr:hypothetical protein [Oceanicola sp. 502str15]MCO6383251.1 hypothetical protein [Oceanicola sp. 502str15]
MRLLPALALAVLPLPAAAQNATIVKALLANLNAPTAPEAQMGAFSACLLGNGNAEETAGIFEVRGWNVSADPEMGSVDIWSDEGPVHVTLYMDGAICSVAHSAQSTALGTVSLSAYLETTGYETMAIEMEGCTGWAIGNGVAVGITSGGQDPVCSSDSDNDVRFTFAQ